MSRFVTPDIKVLKISQGDTLTVKRRLNSGEQRAMFARMVMAGVDGTQHINHLQIGISKILAYLVDWSLVDKEGNLVVIRDQPVEVVTSALDGLDPDSYAEIRTAIEAHETATEAEADAIKNGKGGAIESSATSPSPDSSAGDTNGSESLTLMSTASS